MARRSNHEHQKPEVFRLLAEGFTPAEILEQLPDIPRSTVYDWAKEFRTVSGNGGGTARVAMPIDPESPLDKIINALWDLHRDPTTDGAGIMVQVLNALLRAEQVRTAQFAAIDFDSLSDEQLAKIAKNVS
jgi:uncharacterized protein (DUF433 family)